MSKDNNNGAKDNSNFEEIYKEAKERIPSQKDTILKRLIDSGKNGITNIELNTICLRYSSIIFLLKKDGYKISITNQGGGVVLHTLESETPEAKIPYKKGINILKEELDAVTFEKVSNILDKHLLNIVRKPNGLNKK